MSPRCRVHCHLGVSPGTGFASPGLLELLRPIPKLPSPSSPWVSPGPPRPPGRCGMGWTERRGRRSLGGPWWCMWGRTRVRLSPGLCVVVAVGALEGSQCPCATHTPPGHQVPLNLWPPWHSGLAATRPEGPALCVQLGRAARTLPYPCFPGASGGWPTGNGLCGNHLNMLGKEPLPRRDSSTTGVRLPHHSP